MNFQPAWALVAIEQAIIKTPVNTDQPGILLLFFMVRIINFLLSLMLIIEVQTLDSEYLNKVFRLKYKQAVQ